jgi:hypothetical protein
MSITSAVENDRRKDHDLALLEIGFSSARRDAWIETDEKAEDHGNKGAPSAGKF